MNYDYPLCFLNYDVSRYIYETYFPSKLSKKWKKRLNKQFNYHINEYLKEYKLENIYEKQNRIPVLFSNRSIIYSFTNFLNDKYNRSRKKRRGKFGYNGCTDGHNRARKYRREAHKMKL